MPRKKSPVTRPGIDPGIFRLVAQRLNHYATLIRIHLHIDIYTTTAYYSSVFSAVILPLYMRVLGHWSYQRNNYWNVILSEAFDKTANADTTTQKSVNTDCNKRPHAWLSAFAKLRRRLLASSCLSVYQFIRPSVHPSSWNNSAPNGGICIKFDIWVFFENLSRKCKLQKNLTRIRDILQ
jgi:hypothetical protein